VPSDRVTLTVTEVQLAVPASVGVEAGMVVLTEDQPPGRMLRIIIAQPEARAIMSAWQGAVSGRPSTWDLLQSTISLLGGRVYAVVITAVEEERHYYAILELWQGDERRTLSCRPSDGIALALRAYSQLLAEESVLEAAGVLADGSRPPPKPKPEPALPPRTVTSPTAAQAMGVPKPVASSVTASAGSETAASAGTEDRPLVEAPGVDGPPAAAGTPDTAGATSEMAGPKDPAAAPPATAGKPDDGPGAAAPEVGADGDGTIRVEASPKDHPAG
jgi:bifunctional DNase/RNase